MTLPDFLTEWPFGEIVLTGHRISLYHVIERYQRGMTAADLLDEFPTLSAEKIDKVLVLQRLSR